MPSENIVISILYGLTLLTTTCSLYWCGVYTRPTPKNTKVGPVSYTESTSIGPSEPGRLARWVDEVVPPELRNKNLDTQYDEAVDTVQTLLKIKNDPQGTFYKFGSTKPQHVETCMRELSLSPAAGNVRPLLYYVEKDYTATVEPISVRLNAEVMRAATLTTDQVTGGTTGVVDAVTTSTLTNVECLYNIISGLKEALQSLNNWDLM